MAKSSKKKKHWLRRKWGVLLTLGIVYVPVLISWIGFEAFGLVFLEANACGVPTVGIGDSGAVDAIRDEETGLLAEKGDTAGVAARLDRLFGDAALRKRLGEEGVRWAHANDWDATARGILEVYDQVLARQ